MARYVKPDSKKLDPRLQRACELWNGLLAECKRSGIHVSAMDGTLELASENQYTLLNFPHPE